MRLRMLSRREVREAFDPTGEDPKPGVTGGRTTDDPGDLHRRLATVPRRVWAGALLGGGAFQLYDGVVHHKLLQLHQVRYGVELLPYDLAWNASGAVALVVGLVLLRGPARPLADVQLDRGAGQVAFPDALAGRELHMGR